MKSSYLKVLSASIIVALSIILTAFTGDNENNNWKYIGSYSCRYDNYGSNFYQTTIIVEVYYLIFLLFLFLLLNMQIF